MGLFDSAGFDPTNYQGLLSQLAQSLQFQQPTPSQGFPDSMQTYASGGLPYPVNGQPQMASIPPQGAETFQNQAPPQQQQAPQQLPSALQSPAGGNIGAAFQGFVNAGSPLQALGNLVSGLTTGQRTDPSGMAQQSAQAIYQALRQIPGMPDAVAQAAALDPEIRKTIAPQLYSKPELKVMKDALGQESGYIYRPDKETLTPAESGASAGSSPVGGGVNMYAPGVRQVNSSLSGEDYLNQFSPEVKSAVKAYINGDVMPTGNPRAQGISVAAKTIAQKYGQDMGVPVNDQLYAQKRKMQTDLASSSNGTMGGILANGKSALEHLLLLSKSYINLGNTGGDETPGSGVAASTSNFISNKLIPSGRTKAALSAANDASLHYGQESTKFYSASGGGEAERMGVLNNQNPVTTTPDEQASYLNTEKELMLGRFQQKESQIRDTLGQDYLDRHPVITPDIQKILDGIDSNITKLQSGRIGPSASAAPTEVAPATQTGYSIKKIN